MLSYSKFTLGARSTISSA